MDLSEFKLSLSGSAPPADLSPPLAALWWAGKGEWGRAHTIVMDESGPDPAWVHAYLHRIEGDLDNARYWYRQARQPVATNALQAEWEAIAVGLLVRKHR